MPTRAELEAALRRNPNDARTHLALGLALEEAEDIGAAASCYQRALALDEQLAEAAFRLGMIAMLHEEMEEALPLLVRAVNLDERNGIYWSNLGHLLLLIGHLEESLQAFLAAWEAAPELEQTPIHIARLHVELGQPEEIAAWDDELERLSEDYPEANILRITFYLSQGRLSDASVLAATLPDRFPESADALATAGHVQLIDGNKATAQQLFEQARTLIPDHYDATIGLAAIRGNAGDRERAHALYREALARDDDRYQAYVGLCLLALQEDDLEALTRWNQAGLEKAPEQPELLFFRAKLLARAGQSTEAITVLEHVLTLNPLYYQAHFDLGNLYWLELHDAESSRHHLQAVIDLAPQQAAGRVAAQMLRRLD